VAAGGRPAAAFTAAGIRASRKKLNLSRKAFARRVRTVGDVRRSRGRRLRRRAPRV